jgi:hypothetical protein
VTFGGDCHNNERGIMWKPEVGDIVESIVTKNRGEVIEVNTTYGWFRVKYPDKRIKEYRIANTGGHTTIRKYEPEKSFTQYLIRNQV